MSMKEMGCGSVFVRFEGRDESWAEKKGVSEEGSRDGWCFCLPELYGAAPVSIHSSA